jgi:YesN/AraC family two-component response regulator
VVTADSGAEALSIYAERKTEIAAVITDMTMPMMRGVPLPRHSCASIRT